MTAIRASQARKMAGVTSYPPEFREGTGLFEALLLGEVAGLTQVGVALETLYPGGISSQRHWHANEDEFLYLLSGELVLVENDGETTLHPGDAAGWKAGEPNGHHLINRSDQNATYLIFGTRAETDRAEYPDIDMVMIRDANGSRFLHKDGTPYPKEER